METLFTKSIIAGLLMVLIIISGIFLRKGGEPYKTGTFALHKITVVAVILFVVLVYVEHLKMFRFNGTGLLLFLLSDLFLLVAFITGVMLNFEKTAHYRMKIFHRISSWLTVLMIPVIWWYCH